MPTMFARTRGPGTRRCAECAYLIALLLATFGVVAMLTGLAILKGTP
jgi:hypothetical protein